MLESMDTGDEVNDSRGQESRDMRDESKECERVTVGTMKVDGENRTRRDDR